MGGRMLIIELQHSSVGRKARMFLKDLMTSTMLWLFLTTPTRFGRQIEK